jgi:hypothetical protein
LYSVLTVRSHLYLVYVCRVRKLLSQLRPDWKCREYFARVRDDS